MKRAFITLGAALFCLSTQAQFTGEGDVAYSQVSGNSESNSLTLGVELTYEQDAWRHIGEVDIYSASQDGSQTAEAYKLNAKTRYTYSERTYAFGNGRYSADRFSGYDYQTSIAGGLGRDFIDDGITLLEGEAGVGYRVSDPEGAAAEESEAIFLLTAAFDRVLTDTTVFESDWRVESGSDNTFLQSELALKVAILEALSLRAAFTVKHNTDVPAGTEKTDTLTSIGLNYSF